MNIGNFLQIANDVKVGKNVQFGSFVNLYGCEIGDDCLIGTFVEIQKDVRVGHRVKIQSHTFICSGVRILDGAFIGHGVMFTNDRFPRSVTETGQLKSAKDWTCEQTIVGRGASIGNNVTVLCGVTVGENSIVGAGSVVVQDVPASAVVAGNPAKMIRSLPQ